MRLPFQRQRRQFLEPEPSRRSRRPFGDEHLAGFRRLLQPRRHADRVAGDHADVLLELGSGDHLARVHADPHLERETVAPCQVFVQSDELRPHAERRAQRADRVVFVCGRDAEDGHDRVADELLDRAALGLDRLAHRGEVGVHHVLEALGVQALAHIREAGHIGEENGDYFPFLRGGRGLDAVAARGAEACAFGQGRAAIGARRREGRTARGAEPGFVGVGRRTCRAGLHAGEA